jgi:spoIIIJ-associated protein
MKSVSVESTGKTIDEAIEVGLQELGVTKDKVDIEVSDEGNKGLFGFLGTRVARVRLTLKKDPTTRATEILSDILGLMKIEASVSAIESEEYIMLNISGKNLGLVIGRRGETLDALQYLVNIMLNKEFSGREEYRRVQIDAEGYRKRREETLRALALNLAEKVKREGKDIVLEPMTPQERRIIHITLRNVPYVNTFSEGEEPYRRVVISPRRGEG